MRHLRLSHEQPCNERAGGSSPRPSSLGSWAVNIKEYGINSIEKYGPSNSRRGLDHWPAHRLLAKSFSPHRAPNKLKNRHRIHPMLKTAWSHERSARHHLPIRRAYGSAETLEFAFDDSVDFKMLEGGRPTTPPCLDGLRSAERAAPIVPSTRRLTRMSGALQLALRVGTLECAGSFDTVGVTVTQSGTTVYVQTSAPCRTMSSLSAWSWRPRVSRGPTPCAADGPVFIFRCSKRAAPCIRK